MKMTSVLGTLSKSSFNSHFTPLGANIRLVELGSYIFVSKGSSMKIRMKKMYPFQCLNEN